MKNGHSEGLYLDAKQYADSYSILSDERGFASGLISLLLEFINEHDLIEELKEWGIR